MMLGAGLTATPLAALATSGAAPGEAGLVSGLINTSRTMGGSLGLAVMSTIAAARTASALGVDGTAGAAGSIGTAGRDGGVPEALTEGYALAFRTGAGVLLGGVVLMLVWLPWGRAAAPARVPAGTGPSPDGDAGDAAVDVEGVEGTTSTTSTSFEK
jgi:hypothetical protein